MVSFGNISQFAQIDQALDRHQFEKALSLAREIYRTDATYSTRQLLLLCAAFGANVDVTPGVDLEEKKLCYSLWDQVSAQATPAEHERIALNCIRLACIYTSRGEKMLAHCSLLRAKRYVSYGASSLAYNEAVDTYIGTFNQPDTNLWLD